MTINKEYLLTMLKKTEQRKIEVIGLSNTKTRLVI